MASSGTVKSNYPRNVDPSTSHQRSESQNLSDQTLVETVLPVIQYKRNMWDDLLLHVEFELNCSNQDSTKLAPFKVKPGHISRLPSTKRLQGTKKDEEMAVDYVKRRKTFVQLDRDYLAAAKDSHRFCTNKNRRYRKFEVVDWVMTETKGIDANEEAELLKKRELLFMGPWRYLRNWLCFLKFQDVSLDDKCT